MKYNWSMDNMSCTICKREDESVWFLEADTDEEYATMEKVAVEFGESAVIVGICESCVDKLKERGIISIKDQNQMFINHLEDIEHLKDIADIL